MKCIKSHNALIYAAIALISISVVVPLNASYHYARYSAHSCRSNSGETRSGAYGYVYGGADYWYCPIVRDVHDENDLYDCWVKVYDGSGDDISCTLYIRDEDGDSVWSGTSSSSGSSGIQTLYYYPPHKTTNNAIAYYYCDLASTSLHRIYSYSAAELE